MSNITIPVSIGELIDKITILEIKALHISNEEQLNNVQHEHHLLLQVALTNGIPIGEEPLQSLISELSEINNIIWDTENELRDLEHQRDFSQSFISAARRAYLTNFRRYQVKRKINDMFDSSIYEEKQYG